MEYLVEIYGFITKLDLQVLLDDCKKPCESNSEYFAHAKRIKRNFEELAQHRATVSEYQQMELLIQSTGHLPVIMEATDKYLRDNPVYVNQTVDGLIAHVTLHLTNPTATTRLLLGSAAATTLGTGTAAVKAVEASMDTMTELMVAMMTRMERMEKKLGKEAGKRGNTTALPGATPPTGQTPKPWTKYCFVHGTNPTHEGTMCRVMIADPTFSVNHKNATGPALIEGKQGRA